MSPEQRTEALKAGEQAALAMEQVPFGSVRLAIYQAWKKAETVEARESLHSEINALDRVVNRLWLHIRDAKAAAHEMAVEAQEQA